jgi:DNA-binding transcriptional MerR regulator
MTTDPPSQVSPPVYDADMDHRYSIEVVAELTGVDAQTVIRYQEQGFIRPVSDDTDQTAIFDAETLRQLRRIEHLRTTCAVNDKGIRLILDLLDEVEILRQERRHPSR